jgi:hypothetical protein
MHSWYQAMMKEQFFPGSPEEFEPKAATVEDDGWDDWRIMLLGEVEFSENPVVGSPQ